MNTNYTQQIKDLHGFENDHHYFMKDGRQMLLWLSVKDPIVNGRSINEFFHIYAFTADISETPNGIVVENEMIYNLENWQIEYNGENFAGINSSGTYWFSQNDLESIYVYGDRIASSSVRELGIRLFKCIGDGCATEEEIDYVIRKTQIYIYLSDAYFDYGDDKNPIKNSTEIMPIYLDPTKTIMCRTYIRK